MKLIAATNNQNKLAELQSILSGADIELISLKNAGLDIEIEENGTTFEENAIIKARTVSKLSGMCVIGDDSGLMVDALGGDPGVHSARYAGDNASDKDRIDKLLYNLKGVEDSGRGAKFVCAIAFCTPKGDYFTVRGECKGKILREAKGEGGFGYDPIFYIEEHNKSFAELSPDEKNEISHRGRALQTLKSKKNDIKRMIKYGL